MGRQPGKICARFELMETTLDDTNNKTFVARPQLYNSVVNVSRKQERIGIILVFLLLAVSAMEYFYRSQNYILLAFLISGFYFLRYGRSITKEFLLVVLLFFVVETAQYLLFGGFNVRTFAGTYIRLFLAFSVVAIVRGNFGLYYVKIMFFFSAISLFFYAGSFLPGAESLYVDTLGSLIANPWTEDTGFYEGRPNFVVFCFEKSLFTDGRNSGPFWEPGAFAVFLMIALIFNHRYEPKLNTKKNLIFIICLISTLSTAGYIAFFLFILYINFERIKKNRFYTFLLVVIFTALFYFYETTPFLKEKILYNIELADETTSSRFGSALADINAFKKSPLVGLGRAGAKEGFISSQEFSVDNHRNNGVFDLLSKYGLPLTLIYFYLIYLSFLKGFETPSTKLYALSGFVIILVLGFSQGLFLKPFFYAFLFLPFIVPRFKMTG